MPKGLGLGVLPTGSDTICELLICEPLVCELLICELLFCELLVCASSFASNLQTAQASKRHILPLLNVSSRHGSQLLGIRT